MSERRVSEVPQQGVQRLKVLSAEYEANTGRRMRRQLSAVVRDTALVGGALVAAHFLRANPDAVHQFSTVLPQVATEGITTLQNAVTAASNTVGNAMDTVGSTLNNIPLIGWSFNLAGGGIDVVPHLLETRTPLGQAMGEKALIAGEVITATDFVRRIGRQVEREETFEIDNSRMGYVPRLGYQLSIIHGKEDIQSSRWAKFLSMGDPRGEAQAILKEPTNFWNKRRIGHIIEHAVAEAVAADKKGNMMSKLLSPSILMQAAGEVIEQGTKLGAAHVAGLLGTALVGGVTWLGYLGYLGYEAVKTGSPEKIKIALKSFIPNMIPSVALITGPAFTIPAEISQHRYDKRVGSEFIAGISEIARKDSQTLTQAERDALTLALDAFGRELPKKIRKKGTAKTVADMAIGLPAVIQDLSPEKNRNNLEYKNLNTKVAKIEIELEENMAKMNEMESNGFGYRFRHAIGMRRLANRISKKHKEMYNLMQERYNKFDHPFQLAVALDSIYQDYLTRHPQPLG